MLHEFVQSGRRQMLLPVLGLFRVCLPRPLPSVFVESILGCHDKIEVSHDNGKSLLAAKGLGQKPAAALPLCLQR
jgi:hypothetical protein